MNGIPHLSLCAALTVITGFPRIDPALAQRKQLTTSASSSSILGTHEIDECRRRVQNDLNHDGQDGNRKKSHAFWIQGGYGVASADIRYRRWTSWESFFHANASVHFRRHNRVVAFGFDHHGIEAWEIKSWWGTYGVSHSLMWLESSLSLGAGLTRWYYHTESSRGTIRSTKVPSLLVKAQTIVHAKQTFGFGIALSGNLNKESPYVAGSIVFVLGVWNL